MRLRNIIFIAATAAVALAAQDYNAIYNKAYKLLESGKRAEARAQFEIVLDEAPRDSGLLDNAEYWIANSYLDDKMFDKAIEHYKRAQNLPDGNKHAAAQFEIAKAMAMAGDTISAEMEYYRVLSLYPDADLCSRALARIDSLGKPIEKAKPRAAIAQNPAPKPTAPAKAAPQQKPAAPKEQPSPAPAVKAKPTPQKTVAPTPTIPTAQPRKIEKHPTGPPKPGLTPNTGKPISKYVKIEPEPVQPEKPKAEQKTTPTPSKPTQTPTPKKDQPPKKTPTPVEKTTTPPTKVVEKRIKTASSVEDSGKGIGGVSSVGSREKPTEAGSAVGDSGKWELPDPSKRDDGIRTLPLSGDPRQLIDPQDKKGF